MTASNELIFKKWADDLGEALAQERLLAPEEVKSVDNWQSILARVIDAGDPTDPEHIAYAVNGDLSVLLKVPNKEELERLPSVDGLVNDEELASMTGKPVLQRCIAVSLLPEPSNNLNNTPRLRL